jgi:hypothetical protein
MNANGTYSGLDGGTFNGLYPGVRTGTIAGVSNNETNTKISLVDISKSDVIVAYSVRKISKTYTGPCVRVRRSSDNTEQDIGFDENGLLSENQLLGFLNGSDGFISVWYDQSGSSRNISQSTLIQQPRIATAGIIVKEKGKPIINFDGSDDFLFNNSIGPLFSGTNISKSFICVHKFNVVTSGVVIVSVGAAAPSPIIYFGLNFPTTTSAYSYGNRQDAGGAVIPNVTSTINANTTSLKVFNVYQSGSVANLIIDNIYAANGDITTGVMNPTQFAVGCSYRATATGFANVNIHELIVYLSNQFQNRSIIEQNINNYYKIY